MKIILAFFIASGSLSVNAGSYTTNGKSFNFECDSTERELLWLSRKAITDASSVCWLCFDGSAPLKMMYTGNGVFYRALQTYATAVAPVMKSDKEISNCASASFENIQNILNADLWNNSATVSDFYNESMKTLTACVCK